MRARVIFYVLALGVATGLVTGVAAAGSIGAVASKQPSDRHNWMTYVNDRFQYAICYPQDLLVPQGEPANSDGQRFLSNKDSAELAVYGGNNALFQTLREVVRYSEPLGGFLRKGDI